MTYDRQMTEWLFSAYTVRSRRSRLITNVRVAASFSKVNTACGKTIHTMHTHSARCARGGLPKPQVLHRILTVHGCTCVCCMGPFPWLQLCAKFFLLSKLPNRTPWNGKWVCASHSPRFGDNLHHVRVGHLFKKGFNVPDTFCVLSCVTPPLFKICHVSIHAFNKVRLDVGSRERTCTEKEDRGEMSWLRLLSRARQQIWQSARRRSGSGVPSEAAEGPELPNGFLFNEKVWRVFLSDAHQHDPRIRVRMQPLLPGEKRQKEPWENIWLYGMTFNFLLMIAVVTLKPDTK